MDEQRLIAGYKRGDSQAREQIYELFAPAMMSLCVRYVKSKDDAEDVLQDGFIKVFVSATQYSESGSLGGWIRKIMVNTALEFLRRKKKIEWKEIDENLPNIEIKNENIDMRNISADEIIGCIQKLPEKYRIVFNMVAVEGYDYREISEITNSNEGLVRTQYSRARRKLQEIILELTKE